MLKGKKLILFDMDGTLIDSVGVWNDVDRKLLIELGEKEVENIDVQLQRDSLLREFSKFQNPYGEYCSYLGRKYNSPLSEEEIIKLRYTIAQDYLVNVVDYKPDAEKFLQLLKDLGYTLIIATTTKRGNMDIYQSKNRNILSKAPLDRYFSHIYTREDVKEIKPNPEIYHMIMEKFKVSPEECIIFEDSLIGIEAGKNAGIEVVALYDKYSASDLDEIKKRADYYFNNFSEAISAVK